MRHRVGLRECVVLGLMVAALFYLSERQDVWEEYEAVNAVPEQKAEEESGYKKEIKGKIALTFDDGPHPYYTEQMLDGLKERGVKATFFITGQNAEEYPDIVERMAAEGHLIGNHTYHHTQLTNTNELQFKEEILRTNELITSITGEEILYIRPPYGTWKKQFEDELNMFPVLWTIDPLDWSKQDATGIVKSVVADAGENDIILMHDQYKTTVTAALQIIDKLTDMGYEFVTVEEILFD